MASGISKKEIRSVVADKVSREQALDEATLDQMAGEFLAAAKKLPPAQRAFVPSPAWLHVEVVDDPTQPVDADDLPQYLR